MGCHWSFFLFLSLLSGFLTLYLLHDILKHIFLQYGNWTQVSYLLSRYTNTWTTSLNNTVKEEIFSTFMTSFMTSNTALYLILDYKLLCVSIHMWNNRNPNIFNLWWQKFKSRNSDTCHVNGITSYIVHITKKGNVLWFHVKFFFQLWNYLSCNIVKDQVLKNSYP
jgi:hypothetical protein